MATLVAIFAILAATATCYMAYMAYKNVDIVVRNSENRTKIEKASFLLQVQNMYQELSDARKLVQHIYKNIRQKVEKEHKDKNNSDIHKEAALRFSKYLNQLENDHSDISVQKYSLLISIPNFLEFLAHFVKKDYVDKKDILYLLDYRIIYFNDLFGQHIHDRREKDPLRHQDLFEGFIWIGEEAKNYHEGLSVPGISAS